MSELPELELKIKERIHQVNKNIHPTHNRAYIESVRIEIEMLNWVLSEIHSLNDTEKQGSIDSKV
jgi:hypothetical protein